MKKTTIYTAIVTLLMSSCHKKKAPDTVLAEKYTCECNTSITYVDHCGEANSFSETNYIYSTDRSEASSNCSKQNATASSSSTISTKTCELK